MYEEVEVLTHSSIKINGQKTVYFDPYEVREDYHDADLVFVTHEHFDHYSPADIRKVAKEDTWLILPESMKGQEDKAGGLETKFIQPGGTMELKGLMVKAVPAYNRLKPFHPKSKGWVGYLVTMGTVVYYIAGDTDVTTENQKISCDVALVPVGGKFTMDYKDAAKLVNTIKPRIAIPTHYGSVAGSPQDGQNFKRLVDKTIETRVMI